MSNIHWDKTVSGKHIQSATQQSSMQNLNSVDTNHVQSINITFWYYYHAVDPTMLPDINKISTYQHERTQDTLGKYNQMLDYASTHMNATILYHASDMILMTDTYATYLIPPHIPQLNGRILLFYKPHA